MVPAHRVLHTADVLWSRHFVVLVVYCDLTDVRYLAALTDQCRPVSQCDDHSSLLSFRHELKS